MRTILIVFDAPVLDLFARVVELPVTVDVEAGYGLEPTALVDRLLAIGAAGCNLEDSAHRAGELTDVTRQADYLAAMRSAVDAAGADLVINARVDVFLQQYGEPEQRVAETIERGQRYLKAGADCIFPIFTENEQDIRSLMTAFDGHINLLCRPGCLRLA